MEWTKFIEGEYKIPVKSWCAEVEESAYQQAVNLANHPAVCRHVALMPDCHTGYGMPIGGVIAVKNALIPSAVGVDIGCGMVAVETSIDAEEFADMEKRRALQTAVKARIPVGEGKSHQHEQDWDGFTAYLDNHGAADLWPKRLDRANLGTLGGGNHFIELQKSDAGKIWLMIHSGSRNLGSRVEKHYHEIAQKLNAMYHVELPDKDLAFLPGETTEGHDYWRDMEFAMAYAAANRRRMMAVYKEEFANAAPGVEFLREVNIHHNYAALENHYGENFYIHRKGATSAKAGEIGIIPGSMGTASYIVEGLGNPESFMSCSHGAGRVMSRTAACMHLTEEECDAAMAGIVHDRWQKVKSWSKDKRRAVGLLDFSEAPQAYKAIDTVIAAESDLIKPLVRLTPLAVIKG